MLHLMNKFRFLGAQHLWGSLSFAVEQMFEHKGGGGEEEARALFILFSLQVIQPQLRSNAQ